MKRKRDGRLSSKVSFDSPWLTTESQKQSQEEFNWDEPEGDQPTPTTTRNSEESYDVVSEQGQAGKKKVVEDEDSDWE